MKSNTHNTKSTPLVSVVLPVHNGGQYVKEAIDSILSQTYTHFELIIVNDASTDYTKKTLNSYQKKYPNIVRVIHLDKNLGKSGDPATNIGIQHAKGSFIAKMDSDDIAHPERLAKQVSFLKKHREVFLVGTQAYVIDQNGKIMGIKKTPLTHERLFKYFFTYNPMIHPSIMFRKNMIIGKQFYDLKFSCFNEYYTFFKLMHMGFMFANLPEPLIYYRIHGKNDILTNTKEKLSTILAIRKSFITEFHYLPTFRDLLITLFQTIAIYFMPVQFIATLYMIARGITPIHVSVSLLKKTYTTCKNAAYSFAYAIIK